MVKSWRTFERKICTWFNCKWFGDFDYWWLCFKRIVSFYGCGMIQGMNLIFEVLKQKYGEWIWVRVESRSPCCLMLNTNMELLYFLLTQIFALFEIVVFLFKMRTTLNKMMKYTCEVILSIMRSLKLLFNRYSSKRIVFSFVKLTLKFDWW